MKTALERLAAHVTLVATIFGMGNHVRVEIGCSWEGYITDLALVLLRTFVTYHTVPDVGFVFVLLPTDRTRKLRFRLVCGHVQVQTVLLSEA